jgi:hypothetical protein
MSSGSGQRSDYHIMFVPNKSLLCEMRLKDRGVFGSFTYLDELAINWFPLDSDVISLEKRQAFYNIQNFACFHVRGEVEGRQ